MDIELRTYGIQIAALSETRFAEVWKIKQVGTGYTFFWSERKCERGVKQELALPLLVGKLPGLSKGINECLMTLRPPIIGKKICKHCQCLCTYDDHSR